MVRLELSLLSRLQWQALLPSRYRSMGWRSLVPLRQPGLRLRNSYPASILAVHYPQRFLFTARHFRLQGFYPALRAYGCSENKSVVPWKTTRLPKALNEIVSRKTRIKIDSQKMTLQSDTSESNLRKTPPSAIRVLSLKSCRPKKCEKSARAKVMAGGRDLLVMTCLCSGGSRRCSYQHSAVAERGNCNLNHVRERLEIPARAVGPTAIKVSGRRGLCLENIRVGRAR